MSMSNSHFNLAEQCITNFINRIPDIVASIDLILMVILLPTSVGRYLSTYHTDLVRSRVLIQLTMFPSELVMGVMN